MSGRWPGYLAGLEGAPRDVWRHSWANRPMDYGALDLLGLGASVAWAAQTFANQLKFAAAIGY